MKKISLIAIPAALLMLSVASCDKAKESVTPKVPSVDSPGMAAPTPYAPKMTGVNGALIGIRMTYKMDQMGIKVDVASEIATAMFYDNNNTSSFLDGGTVSLNNIAIEKQTNNSYTKTASTGMTPSDLDLDGGTSWNVSGNGSNNVPSFTYAYGTDFPSYTGELPSSVTKSGSLSFTFNSGTVKNADSVYVAIIAGSSQVIKSYAANAGAVTISASDLSGLPAISDKTAYLEVLPVKMQIKVFSNREYVFIKEQAVVTNININ